VLDHVHEQAGFPRVFLGLFNAGRHTLCGIDIRGDLKEKELSLHSKKNFIEPQEGKLWQMLCHHDSLVIKHKDDLTSPSDYLLLQVFSQMAGCSCILSPLQSEQRILGILAVESCPTWNEAEDLAFIHAVASQTGIALDRLRTCIKLEEAKITLESRVLERTRDLQVANKKLQEVDRLRAKFVAVTSHELRTPLTAIKMFADNMLSGIVGPLEEKQKFYLSRIYANVQRLQRLILDLLDLAQIESQHMKLFFQSVNLTEVIEEVVEGLIPEAVTNGVKICVAPLPHLPIVFGDRDRIFQILNNLVHNAIKFTGPKGTVTITIEDPVNQQVQVCIADTGCGIPPEELKNIFQPYYRIDSSPSPSSGVGLGLALTHELISLHHGKIRVESTSGEGSRFYVSFPSHDHSPTAVGS
jgi:signal transduction histidine kinase